MDKPYLAIPSDGNAKKINDEINSSVNSINAQSSSRLGYVDSIARLEEKIDLLLQASGINATG